MKGPAIFIAIGILSVGTAVAAAQSDKDLQPVSQNTQAQNAANGPLESGSPIHVALTKTIDSNKIKQGDTVTARTVQPTKTNGKTVIPSGAIIEGHITQASARDKGASFSSVGIVFDKANLKNGEQMPLNVTVQAIALPQTSVTGPPNPGTDTAPLGDGVLRAARTGRRAGPRQCRHLRQMCRTPLAMSQPIMDPITHTERTPV